MKPLLTLRCPQRCLLGVVAATPDGPRLAMRERALVGDDTGATVVQRQDHGPFSLDDGQLISYGCRHSAGDVLDPHLPAIRAAVEAVRTGAPGVVRDYIVETL